MALILDSCFSKLARAEEHMQSVQSQINTWINRRPYRMVYESNAENTRFSTILRVVRPPKLERWSVLTGDAFHNLRSVLDHFVYAVAAHEMTAATLESVVKKLAFPLADKSDDFRSGFWHIEDLSGPVRTEIEALQPYNRPHAVLPPVLGLLRTFDDVDKHRLIQMAMAQVDTGEYNQFRNVVIPPQSGARFFIERGELHDGTEIASFVLDTPAANVSYKFSAQPAITLGHAEGPLHNTSSDVGYLFGEMLKEVKIVIERVRAKIV